MLFSADGLKGAHFTCSLLERLKRELEGGKDTARLTDRLPLETLHSGAATTFNLPTPAVCGEEQKRPRPQTPTVSGQYTVGDLVIRFIVKWLVHWQAHLASACSALPETINFVVRSCIFSTATNSIYSVLQDARHTKAIPRVARHLDANSTLTTPTLPSQHSKDNGPQPTQAEKGDEASRCGIDASNGEVTTATTRSSLSSQSSEGTGNVTLQPAHASGASASAHVALNRPDMDPRPQPDTTVQFLHRHTSGADASINMCGILTFTNPCCWLSG